MSTTRNLLPAEQTVYVKEVLTLMAKQMQPALLAVLVDMCTSGAPLTEFAAEFDLSRNSMREAKRKWLHRLRKLCLAQEQPWERAYKWAHPPRPLDTSVTAAVSVMGPMTLLTEQQIHSVLDYVYLQAPSSRADVLRSQLRNRSDMLPVATLALGSFLFEALTSDFDADAWAEVLSKGGAHE